MEIFTPPVIKEKRPPGRQPKHTHEYQVMVGRRVVEDESLTYRKAAKIYGMSHGAINSCVKKYRGENKKTKSKVVYKNQKQRVEDYRHKHEVNNLKLEVADLYLQVIMLKKALDHSAQPKKESSSIITSESLDQLPKDVK